MKSLRSLSILAALVLPLLAVPSMSRADTGHHALLSLSMETPIGQTPDRVQDNTPTTLFRLELPKLVGPVGLFTGGTLQWKAGLPYAKENRAYVGIEASLGYGLTAYTYAERRFDVGDNRIMAGCRYSLDLKF